MEPSTCTTTSSSSNSSCHNHVWTCRKLDYVGGAQQQQHLHVATELHDLHALLTHASCSVRRSDVRHVAERLQQLESVLLCAAEDEAGIPTYNPNSDLAGWIECMLGELRHTVAAPPAAPAADPSSYNPQYNSPPAPACSFDTPSPSSQLTKSGHQCCNHGSCSSPAASSCARGPAAAGTSSSIINVESVPLDVMDELDDLISQYRAENGSSTVLPPACSAPLYPQELGQHQQQQQSGILMSENNAYSSHDDHQPIVMLSSSQQESSGAAAHYQQLNKDRPQLQHCSTGPVDQNWRVMKAQNQLHQVAYQTLQQQQQQQPQPPQQFHELSVHQAQNCGADQACGVEVVYLLMACAEAVQKHELKVAHNLVKEIQALSYPQANGPMAKVAAHFVEGLARRIYNINCLHQQQPQTDAYTDLLYFHFYETCPYLKFAHFTANQAILEAFEGHKMVHLIDFSLMQGLQWPVLIQALALRPGGPPARVRLTGIGPPQPDEKDVLQEVGIKLAQIADSVNVEFDFRGVVASKLDDVEPWMLQVQPGEAVAVNSILQLHKLLHHDSGSEVYSSPIDEVLRSVKSLNPKIITVVEQEANHNNPFFLERFMEALQYYCAMFDSIEASAGMAESMAMALAEMHLGREIVNIVACEGEARLERHEKLSQWRSRMSNAGFRPLHLGSNASKQTSMLLSLFSGDGYTVQENDGCLTLGWHSHPLLSASAWY